MSAARALRSSSPSLVEGEFPLTVEDFARIAEMLRAQSGIHLPEAKATLVYSRLAKRLRTLGLGGFKDYIALVGSPEGADERMAMLAALTTNVTRFYREPHHFEHLSAYLAKHIVGPARAGARVRLWSSACSSGEEPYSMALTLLSVLPEANKLDVKILATDIDPVIVEKAKAGIYSQDAVAPIPSALRERWMTRMRDSEERWRVGDDARALITFRRLNLIGDWPMPGRFDIIFCRNVVIYFEEATQERIWRRFQDRLLAHGRLYIGHSERIETAGFESDGLTIYRLKGRAP